MQHSILQCFISFSFIHSISYLFYLLLIYWKLHSLKIFWKTTFVSILCVLFLYSNIEGKSHKLKRDLVALYVFFMLASRQECSFSYSIHFFTIQLFYTFFMLNKPSWGQWVKPSLSIFSLYFPSPFCFLSPPSVENPWNRRIPASNRCGLASNNNGTRLQKLIWPGRIWTKDLLSRGVAP